MPDNALPNIIFILTDDQRWDALGYMPVIMKYGLLKWISLPVKVFSSEVLLLLPLFVPLPGQVF